MEPLEITYRYSAGYGWDAHSADLRRRRDEILLAGDFTYEATRARVEEHLRWGLEDETLEFEHHVHEDSIEQYLAEREAATPKTAA